MIQLNSPKPVLVTGATGYIGGRLVPRLLEAGCRVRCLVRRARKLDNRVWISHPHVEVVECDVLDTDQTAAAMAGCSASYYLIHSMMAAGPSYREQDVRLARSFARAAEQAGLERIVYLGGLGETGEGLSKHLTSRREVESVLAAGRVPVTVLRAAMIIGSGSASFEILRYLVERLPVMITPRWVSTECQPIGIRNAIQYLIACLDTPETIGKTLDIGGPEIMRYSRILQITASALGLPKRVIVPVPVLTPKLSSLWIHLVTPVSQHIARPLAEGLRNRVVCRNDEAQRLMPQKLRTVEEAVARAVGTSGRELVESTWLDAGVIPGDPDWAGGAVYKDDRSVEVAATPAGVFAALCRVGGKQGWYSASWLWKLRGFIDRLAGGPGLGRGRRRPDRVDYGDVLDFWRVTGLDPDRRLQLWAEMKLPGDASLEFEVAPVAGPAPTSRLRQVATFKPRGLAGILYWFSIKPLHGLVFRKMLLGIKSDAESRANPPSSQTLA
jgi:uncharacterized protein YbjT (DUF2867 family)